VATNNFFPFDGYAEPRMERRPEVIVMGLMRRRKITRGEWSQTSYDYGNRIYNPGLGRFLSVDPLTKSYPMLTPYQFASNRPIDGIDLDGLEYLRSEDARLNISLEDYN